VLFHKPEKALWPGKGEVSSRTGGPVEQEGCVEGGSRRPRSRRLPTFPPAAAPLPRAFTANPQNALE